MSESWLNSTTTNAEIEIPGYKIHRLDRKHKKGGGVCIYTRKDFKVTMLKELSYISTSDFHQLWLKIQVRQHKSFIVCVAYRPPDSQVSCIREELKPRCIEALLMGKQVVIMGDLNCNLLNPSCVEAKVLTDTFSELNMTQLIKDPTRITSHSRSLLDVIMISCPLIVKDSGVVDIGISDHSMVFCTLKLKAIKPSPTHLYARSLKHYDPNQFVTELSLLPFDMVVSAQDAEDKLHLFNQLFTNTLNNHAPVKHTIIKGRSQSFINKDIKLLMNRRDKTLKVFRATHNTEDWVKYKSLRNSVKFNLRNAESNYVRTQIEHCKGNPRSTWKVIKSCIPTKESTNAGYQKDHSRIAEEFNSYFNSVGRLTADKVKELAEENGISITSSDTSTTNKYTTSEEMFTLRDVTPNEVRKIILETPSHKAPGPDKISFRFLKDSLNVILHPLTDIINCSLKTAKYPSTWKLAEVIPIHKDGDHEVASNNRPISLLAAFSKVCDKVVLNQFTAHLTKCKSLSNHQSGNRKNHSTETLNVAFTDTLLEAMDKKQISIVVFIDLSKAFDSIEHDILLEKISRLGVSPAAHEWFKSYLADRSQYVRIGTTTSTTAPLTHGIPQGSVLSPFLFNIYTDSLPSIPEFCNLESYVDDSKEYLSFSLPILDCSLSTLEDDLHRVFEWCCKNSLLINPDKTKMMVIGSQQLLQQLEHTVSIDFIGKTLEPVAQVKDLGTTLDSNLKYNEHIQRLSSSCISKLCQINRVKNLFNQSTLTSIINALVMSKIYYWSSIWSNTSEENIKKIQLIQNYAARVIAGNVGKYDHVSPVLKELGWLPIKEHLQYRDAVLVHKCMYNQAPSYLSQKFIKRNQIHDRETRSQNELDTPKYRTATGQRTFKYRGTKIWNALDGELKSTANLKHFKSKLKTRLLEGNIQFGF